MRLLRLLEQHLRMNFFPLNICKLDCPVNENIFVKTVCLKGSRETPHCPQDTNKNITFRRLSSIYSIFHALASYFMVPMMESIRDLRTPLDTAFASSILSRNCFSLSSKLSQRHSTPLSEAEVFWHRWSRTELD